MNDIRGVFDIPNDIFNDYMIEALELYLFLGITPGGYTTALLSGNLYLASCRADHQNAPMMSKQAKWIYLAFPNGSFGNEDNFKNWCKDTNNIRSNWADTQKTAHMWKILQGAA
jgi:hypothetical protein